MVILQAEILRMQERTNQDIEAIRREASAVADEKVRYVIVTGLWKEYNCAHGTCLPMDEEGPHDKESSSLKHLDLII